MTCIVGIEFGNQVMIGGDIMGSNGWTKVIHTQPKVFKKRDVLFGYTGSYRFGQLIEHSLGDPVVPEDPDQVYRWLITSLAPDIKRLVKESEGDSGVCLIGVRGQLWELQSDFSVLRSMRGYNAVGSGEMFAMGSLFSSTSNGMPSGRAKAEKIVRSAIEAAGTFCTSVGIDSRVVVSGGVK